MNNSKYVATLKAMADEKRLKIIELLANGTLCACDILAYFDFSQPTLSHHMRVLEDAQIVSSYKEGKWKHYSLDKHFAVAFFEKTGKVLSRNNEWIGDSSKNQAK